MRSSRFLLATLKETPTDAEIISHQLMLRAGMIRRVAAGVYDWLPLGLRVLRKIETIVREEMNASGAQEVLLPAVQPAELWQESGRWDDYGPELLRLTDRHQRDYCFGPTHEEIITALAKSEIQSYRQLPTNFYQIQTKFRDEIRPRFGVMRAREFIMKDAYSFDIDPKGMGESYNVMYRAYERIFSRLGLEAQAVEADSGAIGGNFSHEFHVMADSGEDGIALCPEADYSANVEKVDLPPSPGKRSTPTGELKTVDTPGQHTIENLCAFLTIKPDQTLKTLLVDGVDGNPVALLLRGDHELNALKAERLDEVATPVRMTSPDAIRTAVGVEPGSIGPVGLKLTVIADHSVLTLADFTCGANSDGRHFKNVNWGRDLPLPRGEDLRKAVDGDPCPADRSKEIRVRRGIEVGHVFQLGTKYSESMQATVLDENGETNVLHMGCYGIGVTRIVAAAIEQNHDKNGIIWPSPIAPFDVCIVPIGLDKSKPVADTVKDLYQQLIDAGFEVLLDDRNERPGVMFAEMDLIGIPHRLVISERGLKNGTVEYQNRRIGNSTDYPLLDLVVTLAELTGL
jgi:prolyl-tRNA synthetase